MAEELKIVLTEQGQSGPVGQSLGNSGGGSKAFDPAMLAIDRLEREQKSKQIQEQYNALVGDPNKTYREETNKAVDAFTRDIRQAGFALSELAKNRAGAGLDYVGTAIQQFGPLGIEVGAAAKALAGFSSIASNVIDAFIVRGKELEQYSPEIAVANAMAEMNTIMANIDEANAAGPELAKLIEAQNSLEVTLRELLLPIKVVVTEQLVEVVKDVKSLADLTKGKFPAFEDIGKDVIKYLTVIAVYSAYGTVAAALTYAVMNNLLANDNKKIADADANQDWQLFLNQQLADLKANIANKDLRMPAAPNNNGGPLNIPAFQGN